MSEKRETECIWVKRERQSIYVCVYMCVCVYIWGKKRERERVECVYEWKRERERESNVAKRPHSNDWRSSVFHLGHACMRECVGMSMGKKETRIESQKERKKEIRKERKKETKERKKRKKETKERNERKKWKKETKERKKETKRNEKYNISASKTQYVWTSEQNLMSLRTWLN